MCFSMHADLEKLLSLGKITPSLAEKLDRIAPGRYCFHASWGAGKVISWNLPAKKLVIDFEENPEHEVAWNSLPEFWSSSVTTISWPSGMKIPNP